VAFAKLSPRELEALTWAAQGKTYTEIGKIMGITFASVKTYLDTGRHKLGAVNLPHSVALAITYGLIFMTETALAKRLISETEAETVRIYGEMGVRRNGATPPSKLNG
jgi:DNA-binding CsgD family transcriptional regulator